MDPAPYSRGAAPAVIEKCGHVPAFAFGERGESGFPGHGKVRLEAVAQPFELHVVQGMRWKMSKVFSKLVRRSISPESRRFGPPGSAIIGRAMPTRSSSP